MSSVRVTLASVLTLKLGGELLEQEEDNSGATEGNLKRASRVLKERLEEQGEKVVL